MNKKLGFTFGLLSGVFWGIDSTIVAYLILLPVFIAIDSQLVSATLLIGFLHDFISSWFLSLFVYRKYRNNNQSISNLIKNKSTYFIMLAAIFAGPIGMQANLVAISKLGLGLSTTLSATYPAVSAVLAAIFLKEYLSKKNLLGLLLTVCAVAIISYSDISMDNFDYLGFLFAGLCVIGWASESVICSYGMKDEISPEEALLVRQVTSSFASFLLLLSGGKFLTAISRLSSPEIVGLCLLLAIVGTSSYLFYYQSIDKIGSVKATGLNVTYSLWAVFFSVILFDGVMDWRLVLGSVLIIIGSILVIKE